MAPTIVTRSQWGARSPRGVVSTTGWSSRVGVAIHHSAGPTSQTVRQIQDHQMDNNGWSDIGYNWLVTQDGRLWEGRLHTWTAIGAHAGGQNTGWIGVCWIGTSGNTQPSAAALTTIRWVVDEARRRAGRRLDVRGHGQVPGQATECPGSRLRAWIAAGLPIEEDDMTPPEMLAERVDLTNPDGGRWSFGDAIGKDSLTVKAALGYSAASDFRIRNQVLPEVRKAQKQNAAILAAVGGLDTAAILARIDQRSAEDAARDEALSELVEGALSGERDAAEVLRLIAQILAQAAEQPTALTARCG